MSRMDPTDFLHCSATLGEAVIAAIAPEQMGLTTPCVEWTVSELIDHIVTGNLNVAARVNGTPRSDPDRHDLGPDPVVAYRTSIGRLTTAFARDGALTTQHDSPFGQVPGAVLASLRGCEILVHAWDLAHATGQRTDFDPELVAQAARFFTSAPVPRFPDGPFADAQPEPVDGTAADRLAAFLGRRP